MEAGDGVTQRSLALQYEVPESLLGKVKIGLLKKSNEKKAKHFCANLKAVFELQG